MFSSSSSQENAIQQVQPKIQISFPDGQQQTEDGVFFAVLVNGRRAGCRITPEALQDRFGVLNQNLIGGFLTNRVQIQSLVEQLVNLNPSQNIYLVTSNNP